MNLMRAINILFALIFLSVGVASLFLSAQSLTSPYGLRFDHAFVAFASFALAYTLKNEADDRQ